MHNTPKSIYTQEQNPHQNSTNLLATERKFSLGLTTYEVTHTFKPHFLRFSRQNIVRKLLPESRVSACIRAVKPNASFIPVQYSSSKKIACYRNLMVCGLQWLCPVCSNKISNFRRQELHELIENSSYKTSMVSFTLQHTRRDSLGALITALTASMRLFKNSRHYKSRIENMNVIGNVQALEIVYGAQGWHPHYHLVQIHNSEFEAAEFEAWSKDRWSRIVRKQGAYASAIHGLKFTVGNNKVHDYVAKFGVDQELAGDKKSKGLTPFQLLDDPKNHHLFLEYSEATRGKNQLRYSRGLKQILRDQVTNFEIAKDVTEFDITAAILTRPEWSRIINKRQRAELLKVAADSYKAADPDILSRYLRSVL